MLVECGEHNDVSQLEFCPSFNLLFSVELFFCPVKPIWYISRYWNAAAYITHRAHTQ